MKLRHIPVLKRLYPSLAKRTCRLLWPGGYLIKKTLGVRYLLNHNNYIDRQIVFYGSYEKPQLLKLEEYTRKLQAGMLLDIGANFGLYTVTLTARGAVEKAIAFEPDPRSVAQLQGNPFLNQLSQRVEVRSVAVSSKVGTSRFRQFPATSTGQSKVSEDGDGISVPCITIDSLELEHRQLAFKIDVEGHELEIVKGMGQTLKDNTLILQIESFSDNQNKLVANLENQGCRMIGRIEDDFYFTNSPGLI